MGCSGSTAADDEVMSTIDLPRQDYIGNGDWHAAGHWLGGNWPDSGDDAYLRDNNIVSVRWDAHVENLWLSNSSDLWIESGNTLRVGGLTTIDDTTSRLCVSSGAEAKLGNVIV